MKQAKPRLGRGLDSLLSPTRLQELQEAANVDDGAARPLPAAGLHEQVLEVPTELITCNPHQPRKAWDEHKLAELADSIKSSGLIQPIVVRALSQGYQLIAGERRLRACQIAGRQTVTAIIRDASEDQMLEWALVENIQRTDLNAVERARAYRQYINRCQLTQQQAAAKLGQDRATIANYMRLLELPQTIRELLGEGQLSMGHARTLLAVAEPQRQLALAQAVVAEDWSVRELERRVRNLQAKPSPAAAPRDPHLAELEEQMARCVGTKVSIRTSGRKKHRGRIIIDFYSLDDFDRIRGRLQVDEPTQPE